MWEILARHVGERVAVNLLDAYQIVVADLVYADREVVCLQFDGNNHYWAMRYVATCVEGPRFVVPPKQTKGESIETTLVLIHNAPPSKSGGGGVGGFVGVAVPLG